MIEYIEHTPTDMQAKTIRLPADLCDRLENEVETPEDMAILRRTIEQTHTDMTF